MTTVSELTGTTVVTTSCVWMVLVIGTVSAVVNVIVSFEVTGTHFVVVLHVEMVVGIVVKPQVVDVVQVSFVCHVVFVWTGPTGVVVVFGVVYPGGAFVFVVYSGGDPPGKAETRLLNPSRATAASLSGLCILINDSGKFG